MSITQDTSALSTPSDVERIDLTAPEPSRMAVPGQPSGAPAGPGRPVFTITEAATACAVSRKTITRKLGDLAEHGAAKDEDGVWRIPVEALLAVGLHPGRSLPDRRGDAPEPTRVPSGNAVAPRLAQPVGPDVVTISRDRWDDLRIRLARAEAQAAERDLALADARLALRALTAGPATAPAAALPPPAGPAVGAQPVSGPPSHPRAAAPMPGPDHVEPVVGPQAAAPVPGNATSPQEADATTVVQSAGGGIGPAAAGPPSGSAAELAVARSEAARTGGYVPAANQPAKRRRWWQSK